MNYSDCFGRKSSRIILGTAYFGDGITKEDAVSMMDTFREMGGTHIDTARLYANGKSEEIVGDWLKSRNAKEMILSSKGGYYAEESGEAPRINREEIFHDVEHSLKALKQDFIEFYWLHKDDENKPVDEIINMMNDLIKSGKILKFGASNWTTERICRANQYADENGLMGFSASQIRFNPAYCLGERGGLVGMDADAFEFYKKNNMPVVAYSSQAKGFFSKMAEKGESALSEKAKKRYLCRENIDRLEVLKQLSKQYSTSIAGIICGAFSSFEVPEVFPVIGGSRLEQIKDSLSGADVKLEKQELENIFKFNI